MIAALKNPPPISVLLPIFNAEAYLSAAVESILSQTYGNFELLAIDDGSTDNSLALLRKMAKNDARIRVVSRPNRGVVETLNEGIDMARGQWIARMDADDIARPNRFALQKAHLRKTRADFCGGTVKCFGDWVATWKYPITHKGCEVQLLFDVPFSHPAVMGRKSAFAKLRYSSDHHYSEDFDLWQRAWSEGYRLTNVADIILDYRVHERQVSSTKQDAQRKGADSVRRRHLRHILPELDISDIGQIVDAMREGKGKTKWFNEAFEPLFENYPSEAKEVLSFNCYKIYCKLAGQDLTASSNWLSLSRRAKGFWSFSDYKRAVVLTALSLFKVGSNSRVFQLLRRLRAKISPGGVSLSI